MRTKRLMVRGSFNLACSFSPSSFFLQLASVWVAVGPYNEARSREIHSLHVGHNYANQGFGLGGGAFRKCANAAAEGLYLEVIEKQGS